MKLVINMPIVHCDPSILENVALIKPKCQKKKRKYISSTICQGRINKLTESIKSTEETIKLLLKQKEQYFNINKFQQAADVNSTILEKNNKKT